MKRREHVRNVFDNLFLHSKPVKMLIALRSDSVRYATQVSKTVDCTYSHTVKVLELFSRLGLVNFDKKGRIKLIKLTPDGEEIAHDFEGLRKKFSRISSNIKELPTKPKTRTAKR
jgi:predicted transcriptional regulator